jgi:hypothetical protein
MHETSITFLSCHNLIFFIFKLTSVNKKFKANQHSENMRMMDYFTLSLTF